MVGMISEAVKLKSVNFKPRGTETIRSRLVFLPPASTVFSEVPHLTGHIMSRPRLLCEQEAFEKCCAHSSLRAAARRFIIGLGVATGTVARRLRINVHDDNDNAWQRGPLWPHWMGPITCAAVTVATASLPPNSNRSTDTIDLLQKQCLLQKFSQTLQRNGSSKPPPRHEELV